MDFNRNNYILHDKPNSSADWKSFNVLNLTFVKTKIHSLNIIDTLHWKVATQTLYHKLKVTIHVYERVHGVYEKGCTKYVSTSHRRI